MCGIVGAVAQRNITPILVEGLRRLEYRGYDSAGVAVLQSGHIELRRAVGKVAQLDEKLAQKPLAMSYGEARDCVELCAKAGVTLAVNQNMRYDQSVRALKDLLRRGWLGEPVLGTIEMRAIPHWMPWQHRPEAAQKRSCFLRSSVFACCW